VGRSGGSLIPALFPSLFGSREAAKMVDPAGLEPAVSSFVAKWINPFSYGSKLGAAVRFKLTTSEVEARRSVQLSYAAIVA
jgi:hypothetical protein